MEIKEKEKRFWIWEILIISLFLFSFFVDGSYAIKPEAYVTLLYGNSYGLAATVMFQSLIKTGTQRWRFIPMIILTNEKRKSSACYFRCEFTVETKSKYFLFSFLNEIQLKNLGVLCLDVPILKNPYEGQARYNPRFGDVMSKLNIWNLTQYETVGTLIFQ